MQLQVQTDWITQYDCRGSCLRVGRKKNSDVGVAENGCWESNWDNSFLLRDWRSNVTSLRVHADCLLSGSPPLPMCLSASIEKTLHNHIGTSAPLAFLPRRHSKRCTWYAPFFTTLRLHSIVIFSCQGSVIEVQHGQFKSRFFYACFKRHKVHNN